MPFSYSALWIAHTLVKHAGKCLDEFCPGHPGQRTLHIRRCYIYCTPLFVNLS